MNEYQSVNPAQSHSKNSIGVCATGVPPTHPWANRIKA